MADAIPFIEFTSSNNVPYVYEILILDMDSENHILNL